jgi:peptidyl-prolyl cis-trans isomerase A (cyclophilin A)
MTLPARNRASLLAIPCLPLGGVVLAAILLPGAAAQTGDSVFRLPNNTKPGLYLTFQTDKGAITCKLFEAEAPITVRTMVELAIGKISYHDPETQQVRRNKFFDGITFYRVAPNILIQAGDPHESGSGHPEGPGFPYKTEVAPSLKFDTPGRPGMASSGPDKNDSHFFITAAAYPSLNGRHTIWGQCGNVDVVKTIAAVPKDEGDRPLTPIHIQRAVVQRIGPAPADAPEAMPSGEPPH